MDITIALTKWALILEKPDFCLCRNNHLLEFCGNGNDANAGIDLEHVDVEVDGGVEGGEQVGDAGHVLHPGRPDHLLVVDDGHIENAQRRKVNVTTHALS